MKQIMAHFEAHLLTERRVATNTFSAYQKDIEQLYNYLVEQKIVLEKITCDTLKSFLHHLKGLNLTAASMSRKISALKLFFNYINERYGYTNAAQDLIFPKLEKKLPTYLPEQDVEQLLLTAAHDASDTGMRNKVMLYLLYGSGMRISELTNLCCSDIHFDTGFIAIAGKGGKHRMVPLPQPLLALLKEYIVVMQQKMSNKRKGNTPDYLFPVTYGGKIKPITRQAFWTILRQLCLKAGIKRSISPHTLRHSLATHMLKRGADLRSLQLILGHENLATVQIYTHVETGHLRKVYDKKHPRS